MVALPLTAPEHEHSASIDEAAAWLASAPSNEIGRRVVPMLQARFGLSPSQAVDAIRQANLRRARAL